jgi:Na+/H+ antiporter NhaD/arsenite permease-like protein
MWYFATIASGTVLIMTLTSCSLQICVKKFQEKKEKEERKRRKKKIKNYKLCKLVSYVKVLWFVI